MDVNKQLRISNIVMAATSLIIVGILAFYLFDVDHLYTKTSSLQLQSVFLSWFLIVVILSLLLYYIPVSLVIEVKLLIPQCHNQPFIKLPNVTTHSKTYNQPSQPKLCVFRC